MPLQSYFTQSVLFLIFPVLFFSLRAGNLTESYIPSVEKKSKPGWFWYQPVNCGLTAVGLARHSILYPKNSKEEAYHRSIHSFMRQLESQHSGGHAFSITERGAVWLGEDHKEIYDNSQFDQLLKNLPVLDYQVSGNLSLVLVGSEQCMGEVEKQKSQYTLDYRPLWIDQTPRDDRYIYAVGVSQGYYYSESSWELAEHSARRNLSAFLSSRVKGMHFRHERSDLEIIYSDSEVTLLNAVTQSRYHDHTTNLYYVLVRMPFR